MEIFKEWFVWGKSDLCFPGVIRLLIFVLQPWREGEKKRKEGRKESGKRKNNRGRSCGICGIKKTVRYSAKPACLPTAMKSGFYFRYAKFNGFSVLPPAWSICRNGIFIRDKAPPGGGDSCKAWKENIELYSNSFEN